MIRLSNSIRQPLYHVYLLLFPITYVTLLLDYQLAFVPAVPLLVWSYVRLFRREHEVVLYLILFSRCINGFLVPESISVYNLGNILTCYLPLFIAVVQRFWSDGLRNLQDTWLKRYKFTLMYILLMVAYSLIDIPVALYGVKIRLQPMVFFLLAVTVMMHDFPVKRLMLFFRYVFLVTIICYFMPGYSDVTRELLVNGVVFKNAIEANQYFILDTYFRNLGIFWDCRILGLFAVVAIYIALVNRPRGWGWDLLLAYVALITSLARAPMAIGLVLGVGAFILGAKIAWHQRVLRVTAISILAGAVVWALYMSPLQVYVESFSLISEDGALSQRAAFREYALAEFEENPFGHGLGFLKSPAIDRTIAIGDSYVTRASDAFWFILLAEVGVVGTLLFALSFFEIIYRRSLYTILLLGGLAVQLLGTDVPDMGAYYFVFLILVSRDFNGAEDGQRQIPV